MSKKAFCNDNLSCSKSGKALLKLMLNSSFVSLKLGDIMAQPQFSPQERAFLVTECAKTQNVTMVLREFRIRFPNTRCPSRQTVYRKMAKYRATGTG